MILYAHMLAHIHAYRPFLLLTGSCAHKTVTSRTATCANSTLNRTLLAEKLAVALLQSKQR
jgi:hypothetical protein